MKKTLKIVLTILLIITMNCFVGCGSNGAGSNTSEESIEKIKTPKISIETGVYSTEQNLTIKCDTEKAIIKYTLDGTEPNESSTIYTEAIKISKTTVIKAKAFKDGMITSDTSEAKITIEIPVVLNSISVKTMPNKINYYIGEKLDLTGLIVEGTYSDGVVKTETVVESNIVGFDTTTIGIKILTITIKEKMTTFNIEVKSEIVKNIEVTTACGKNTMIIRNDGNLYGIGYNANGEIGDGTTVNKNSFVKVIDNVKAVACGTGEYAIDGFTMIIKQDGTLWGTGDNDCGQLGDGTTEDKKNFIKIMDKVKSVSCGDDFTMIIKEDGSLWGTGDNGHGISYYGGQLGDGTIEDKRSFVKIMDGVKSVACGWRHTMIIKEDGSLWGTGENEVGQLGDGTTEKKVNFVKVMDRVKSVSCGDDFTMIIKEDGSLWGVGDGSNYFGEIGDGTLWNKNNFKKVADKVKSVVCGPHMTMIIKEDGSLWGTGDNRKGQLGDGTTINKSSFINLMDKVKNVSCGRDHVVIIKEDESLWGTGDNSYGQLGSSIAGNTNSFKLIM